MDERDDAKLERSGDIISMIEKSGPYVVRDGITLKMDEVVQSIHLNIRRRSTANLESRLVTIFKGSTIKMILDLVRELAAK